MTPCHIALGGNLGDVPATFAEALSQLQQPELRLLEVSSLYATPPMGSDAGGPFLNAAASFETSLEAAEVLDRLLAVEDALGRRRHLRWGPRAIDLDLIFFGHETITTPRLVVPHSGCWYRRFVLDPLAEIAPDAMHAASGGTVRELRQRLLVRPFVVGCDGEADRSLLEAELGPQFPDVTCALNPNFAALRVSTVQASDVRERRIALPRERNAFLDSAQAMLVAALSAPTIAGTLPINAKRT
jgi:2-amino-4-hydroxy-6-hydroxymethyldihydropteridine diphosphokinase